MNRSFSAADVFLRLNDLKIEASTDEIVELMLAVADGRCGESATTAWLKAHTKSINQ